MRIALIIWMAVLAAGCAQKKQSTLPHPSMLPPPGVMPQFQTQGPQVTIQGEVRHPVVAWTPDLTLGRALVIADYIGSRDPQSIVIFRGDQAIRIETRHLLSGVKNPPLLPGDVIELRR